MLCNALSAKNTLKGLTEQTTAPTAVQSWIYLVSQRTGKHMGVNDLWYIIAFIIGAWFGIGIMAVVGIAKGD
jgi:hypothetical protein